MCGIGGIYNFSGNELNKEQIISMEAMKKHMHLRGPDACDHRITDNVGLVHTRLSIIDLDDRSTQPMESESWLLSFNGEIINYQSLRLDLAKKYQFKTQSDTEVLLLALEEWGIEKTLKSCAGMFAFLAYNKKTKLLYAARDPLGIKPLYYSQQSNQILFASTPGTIVASQPQVIWSENKSAMGSYFALGAPFTKASTVNNIFQLPPASYLTVLPDRTIEVAKYWEPVYQEQFHMDDLKQIILEYKVSDVKSALFMSGGIDSTFLGSVLQGMDFFHLDSSEKKYAKKAAKRYNSPLVMVKPTSEVFSEGIELVCNTFGEPLMSAGIPYCVSHEASKQGYRMAISANGADELLFGYSRTPLGSIPHKLPVFEDQSNYWVSEQLAHIFRNKKHFHIEEYQEYIPSIIDIGLDVIKQSQLNSFPECSSHRWLDILTYVVNDLNPTLDAASMACSLEVRVPFLDHRIVQGLLSWPVDKICTKKYGRKTPLKEHLSHHFNQEFLIRPKLGFSIDNKTLSHIQQISDKSFQEALDRNFIKIKKKQYSKYYDRDILYLKNIVLAYQTWEKNFGNNLKTRTSCEYY